MCPGAVVSWCDPDQREALGRVIAKAEEIAASMSKTQLVHALAAFGKVAHVEESKSSCATTSRSR